MFFWEVRRKFNETDVDIFDFHSSTVDEFNDIRQVMDKILERDLMRHCTDRISKRGRMISDLYIEGIGVTVDGETIMKVKKSLLKPNSVYDDFEDLDAFDLIDHVGTFFSPQNSKMFTYPWTFHLHQS